MTPIMPEGTAVRKAIQWISQKREEERKSSLMSLIDQACIRFNLAPKDCDFLHRFFSEQETSRAKEE
ncbi:MAG: hypothetical protein KKH04_00035 [Proteobacteria bacterium]|nr:hypothetical protein [Pseudomonadota bacterium]